MRILHFHVHFQLSEEFNFFHPSHCANCKVPLMQRRDTKRSFASPAPHPPSSLKKYSFAELSELLLHEACLHRFNGIYCSAKGEKKYIPRRIIASLANKCILFFSVAFISFTIFNEYACALFLKRNAKREKRLRIILNNFRIKALRVAFPCGSNRAVLYYQP